MKGEILEEQELVKKLRYEDKLKLEDIAEKLNRSVYWVVCRLSDKYTPAASGKRFEILKEESFNLDFVKNVLKNKTNNLHRDKYLEIFNSEGLSTNKYKFWDLWEDFAEFLLSKDFKLYKINKDIDYVDPSSEKTQELMSKFGHKRKKILCDIFKRKYEFEQIEGNDTSDIRLHKIGITERMGKQFYFVPLNKCVFFLPKDEVDNTEDGRRRLNRIEEQRKTGKPRFDTSLLTFLLNFERFLTPAEKDEYTKECNKIQEITELGIQRVETIYGSYISLLAENNITLSDDESQFLKELIITRTPTLDFLGITRPNSSFSRPFYFIEVKSSKSGYARVSSVQKKFIEKAKEKFGILNFHIKIEPNEVRVKFFSPK